VGASQNLVKEQDGDALGRMWVGIELIAIEMLHKLFVING
jgi:hypothetical protein